MNNCLYHMFERAHIDGTVEKNYRERINMFGSLKKKFNDAWQESARLSETLHQQYLQRINKTSTPDTPSSSESVLNFLGRRDSSPLNEIELPSGVNLAAGCQLLAKYEKDWEQIHFNNDLNGTKAEAVAEQIGRIEQRLTTQRNLMADLVSCLSEIPLLVEKLQASTQALKEISVLNAETENRLEDLENLCEECDLQEFMLQKQCELSVHKQKKMAELESYRQRIATEHQQKIRQHEQSLRQIQRERQAVFDDAFRNDLEEFKQKGSITKIQKQQQSKEVPLEEVVLEDTETKDALEDFLND